MDESGQNLDKIPQDGDAQEFRDKEIRENVNKFSYRVARIQKNR